MLTFHYVARDPTTGEKVHADVQAATEQAAAKIIRDQGLAPLEITAEAKESRGFANRFLHRIKSKDKVLFSRQLSTLINAGLPLIQSLRTVAGQATNKQFKVVISQIISDVEAGSTLSVALSQHPGVFNQVYISLVAAGETSGTLDQSLERLATQQEKDAELLSKVRGAMVYPIVVLTVMMLVVGFMVVKVVPQVQVLYRDIPGATLPLITRMMLAVSHFFIHFWWVVLLLIGLAIFFGSRWARSLGGRRFVDKFKMRAWPIGPLFMKMYMARFARTATTLVGSGVPLIQVLEVTANAINNMHVADSIKAAAEKVKGGKALSDALKGDPNFLELVPNMLHVGEQSGAIEQMLSKTADYYEREVDNEIKTISTVTEPLLMIVLGVVAFIVVAAVLLPIYGLAGKTIIH
jgi:type IV pilus assembly protein PilC